MASSLACVFLHGAGIEAVRRGTVVLSNAGGGFQFDVADACSGLRSLTVMTALAAPYAYLTLTGFWRRMFLFCMSVPLAMLANALRIFSLGAVAEWLGMDLAMMLYHDLSGYLVFFLSLLLLIGTGSLIQINWRAKLCALKPKKRSRA
jgi:exosortase